MWQGVSKAEDQRSIPQSILLLILLEAHSITGRNKLLFWCIQPSFMVSTRYWTWTWQMKRLCPFLLLGTVIDSNVSWGNRKVFTTTKNKHSWPAQYAHITVGIIRKLPNINWNLDTVGKHFTPFLFFYLPQHLMLSCAHLARVASQSLPSAASTDWEFSPILPMGPLLIEAQGGGAGLECSICCGWQIGVHINFTTF